MCWCLMSWVQQVHNAAVVARSLGCQCVTRRCQQEELSLKRECDSEEYSTPKEIKREKEVS